MRPSAITMTRNGCAGTLFMGNSVYMYLSIAFIQMLKSLGTVGVFSIGCIFGVEKFSVSTLANMVRHLPCSCSQRRVRRLFASLRPERTSVIFLIRGA